MSRKRRTHSERQHKKERAGKACSEQAQDASPCSSAIDPDGPDRVALESAPTSATLREAELEHRSCGDVAPVTEEFIGEPAKCTEEHVLDEIYAIQDYMDALMIRVRGENAPDPVFVPAAPRSTRDRRQARSENPLAAETAKPDIKPDGDCLSLPPLAELQPRSKPPESMGWGSMRELANSQSRAAIDTHHRIRREKNIRNNCAAGLACLIGTVVAWICAPIPGQAMGLGMMAGAVASVYFLYASFLSARAWLASRANSFD